MQGRGRNSVVDASTLCHRVPRRLPSGNIADPLSATLIRTKRYA
jgi:hypothetical protein